MLSRVAVSLYVLGRHLERAEHVARILRVHSELALDRAVLRDERFWPRFLELAGWSLADHLNREQAIELAVAGSAGPSVRREVAEARRAAQSIRPSLSTEVYEQLNVLHWRLQDSGGRDSDLYSFLRGVELGAQLVSGLVDDTMAHDETWHFVRLGKFLQRAGDTTRLVLRKSAELARFADDAVDWAAALRCCTSFEPYQQRFAAPIDRERVVGYLLFDRVSPRSAAFCLGEALRCVQYVDGGEESEPQRVLERMRALFEDPPPPPHEIVDFAGTPPDIPPPAGGGAVGGLEAAFGELRGELEGALRARYFLPSRLAVALPGDELVAHPHQQQQGR
jgi:uncharacterized alpha-E superfamily protein